ncbi:MAG: PIN domain-containing protein [Roseiflexus sp.]|nr:PIN domain-containing protein [Roseiflexus sp.]
MHESLLDTDIFSEILKGVDPVVAQRASAYRATFGRYMISSITVMEIIKGLHKIGREDRIQQLLQGLAFVEILAFDKRSAELAGRIAADLERTGQPIGRADPMVAAIALQHRLTLVTGNTAHYERVKALGHALEIENWRV